jgi:hypothetical protein
MANVATEVRVASDGHIRVAAVDTAAPADATSAPGAGWTDLGYASEDGVTITPSLDTEDINAWQSAVPVRRIVTGSALEIGFTLIQSNTDTLSLYFNADVVAGVAGPPQTFDRFEIPVSPDPLERALLIDWIDGGENFRLVVPRAQLTDAGELTLARGEPVGFEMTFTALAPATGPLATVLTEIA